MQSFERQELKTAGQFLFEGFGLFLILVSQLIVIGLIDLPNDHKLPRPLEMSKYSGVPCTPICEACDRMNSSARGICGTYNTCTNKLLNILNNTPLSTVWTLVRYADDIPSNYYTPTKPWYFYVLLVIWVIQFILFAIAVFRIILYKLSNKAILASFINWLLFIVFAGIALMIKS